LQSSGFEAFSSGTKRLKTFTTKRCQRTQLRGTEEQNHLPLAQNAGRTHRSEAGGNTGINGRGRLFFLIVILTGEQE
jgi:hypothetical protein